jgi:prefoldin subunit 5
MQIDGIPVTIGDILHLAELVALVGGGFALAYRLGKTHTAITAAIEKQDIAAQRHTSEIAELKTEIKKLNDVLTALAVQENRLDMHEKWIDELRRGLGWRIARSE